MPRHISEHPGSGPAPGRRKFLILAGAGVTGLAGAALFGAAWLNPAVGQRMARLKDRAAFHIRDRLTPRRSPAELAERLFAPDDALVIGPSGPGLVEFINYNCAACKFQHRTLTALRQEGATFRLIVRQKPKPGTTSELAARAVIAATLQGVGHRLHGLFMDHPGTLREEDILALAVKAGAETKRLEADMSGPMAAHWLDNDADLAWLLRLVHTPSFVTRTEAIEGVIGQERFYGLLGLPTPEWGFPR